MLTNFRKFKTITYSPDTALPEANFWLRIIGQLEPDELQKIGEQYMIHELNIEDIYNDDHQAKYENHTHYSLLILKVFQNIEKNTDLDQISIIYGKNFIITYEAREYPFITKYFNKLDTTKAIPGIDRAVYDLMDHIVDHYLECAENYQDRVDALENSIMEVSSERELNNLFSLRRDLHRFHRVIRPVQDIVEHQRRDFDEVSEHMQPYIKNLWDHTTRAVSLADGMWETLINLHTEILTQLQYRLSRTMNIMTTVSVIFLPLMVITGIYGMNFDFMPELHMKHAYPLVLMCMGILGIGMFIFFKTRDYFR